MILFVDTASVVNQVSLLDEKLRVLSFKKWEPDRDQAKKLLPHIQALLKKQKADFSDLGRVIVVIGPGPFTGVRIGIAVSNAISYALRVPVWGIKLSVLEDYESLDNIPKNLFAKKRAGEFIEPFYIKPANITNSKK